MSHFDMPPDFEERLHARMHEMFAEASKIQSQVDAAQADGREVASVIAAPNVRRGDIIEVKRFNEEFPEGDPDSKRKARVIAASPVDYWNPETQEAFPAAEVLCIILEDDDLTTADEFDDLYGEGESDGSRSDEDATEVQEASPLSGEAVPVESVPGVPTPVEVTSRPVDPNVCECGADRLMCLRNQDLVGMHINE